MPGPRVATANLPPSEGGGLCHPGRDHVGVVPGCEAHKPGEMRANNSWGNTPVTMLYIISKGLVGALAGNTSLRQKRQNLETDAARDNGRGTCPAGPNLLAIEIGKRR